MQATGFWDMLNSFIPSIETKRSRKERHLAHNNPVHGLKAETQCSRGYLSRNFPRHLLGFFLLVALDETAKLPKGD